MVQRLALLGDSMAAGRGATRRSETPAARLARYLHDDGRPVTTRVFAVSGARSSDLGQQVDRAMPWRPDVALIVIGANDLIHRVPARRAARDLGEAVRRLRAAGAEVVVAPAPDLSVLPETPGGLRPVVRSISLQLRSAQVRAAQAAGARIADCDHATAAVFASDRALFSPDRFHPSGAGYAVIAEALHRAVAEALRAQDHRAAGA